MGQEQPPTNEGPGRGLVDRERVRAQMREWQDRVLDLTKSNPLIGLNRSRVTKLRVLAPDATPLFGRVVLDEASLRLPLVRTRPAGGSSENDDLFENEVGSELVVDSGDITFDAKPIDLMRALKRIYDNARTTVEERGVTTLHLSWARCAGAMIRSASRSVLCGWFHASLREGPQCSPSVTRR